MTFACRVFMCWAGYSGTLCGLVLTQGQCAVGAGITSGEPTCLNRGNGIEVFDSLDRVLEHIKGRPAGSSLILQKYIERPMRLGGRKFDIRAYILVGPDGSMWFHQEVYICTSWAVTASGTFDSAIPGGGLTGNVMIVRPWNQAKPVVDNNGTAGMLYTWGCEFSWMEGGKRDKHYGCLGLGDDTEGRLVPTRVQGDMDKHGVLQVDGNLFGMFVEEVACGMRHVVVVASKVQANGQIPDDQRRVRLLAWGCGAEGQLGLWGMTTSSDAPVAVRTSQNDHSLPQSRSTSVASYQSVVGAVATGVRDAGSAAAFQLSQSLPITVAAAGLQSLQQMVTGGSGPRSKGGSTPTAAPDVSYLYRRRQSRVVGIPQLTVGQPRSDHHHHRHRSDLRRSTTRLLASYHGGLRGHASQKALPLESQEGQGLEAGTSAGSGIVSQRSSSGMGQPSEDIDSSRSTSPTTSSALYGVNSADGDFHMSRHLHGTAIEVRQRANSMGTVANGSSTALATAPAPPFGRALARRGSSGNAADAQSLGGTSTGDTPETDTDSYAHGGRSLDMVPEQMKSPTGPAALPPRLSRLAQQTPGSGAVIAAARDDRLAEAVGSSVSTMDSSYTAEASVSSELSPSGIVTTSPGMPHGVQLPYTISEALPPISPPAPQQQHLPFAAHHTMPPPQQQYQPQPQHQPQYQHQYQLQQHQHPLQPQHQQLTTLQASTLPPPQQQPQQPQAWHTSLGPILTTQEPMARAQVAAMAAGGPGPGPSGPGNSTGRSRESSASMWAPPLPIAVGGVASGHGAMRAYGVHSDGAAAAVANAAVAVAGPHAAAVNMPVGPGLHSGGSRGSRGHSRHASYDSIDVNSRDGDGVSQRGNSGGVGGGAAVDARATPFVLYGGGAAATAPPPPAPLQRIAADPTSDLLQQNLQLQRELELLRQQVALFTQVTGLAPAALAAAGMSPTNTYGPRRRRARTARRIDSRLFGWVSSGLTTCLTYVTRSGNFAFTAFVRAQAGRSDAEIVFPLFSGRV
ncbi:hypothetical protein VOLCADRAFT_99802 [Volvox carteri f. nagariensis]|uniref:DOMON domain-containing protein n=1 Tax=Volvox carteri f. nagariensis TaxID=3068 RepID=D8UIP3_VOLCA|nr:uncharacterized protein VOLCADRAFT_99802 [Volvox carteri f. nagariensis]EFJ40390.1 hypothetical protein VOLCADRAFT_99802 [Volvox carteri f. nagariensis]|eukprot:XP_002958541.1 hypothetical protein VOLCADRAFT_99802 [Volvox carteri f. nagariensis]